MSIAVIVTDRNTDQLCQQLQKQLPTVSIQQWPDIPKPETVVLAVLWHHPPGITKDMSQLKAVISMGAGMDHIEADQFIDSHITKERTVTLALKQNMAQYVLLHILTDLRHASAYQKQQAARQWLVLEQNKNQPIVGFLGLGALGGFVADKCVDLGLQTMAWTQTQQHPQHPCFHGQTGLKKVCENSDYLVVLLPLNQHTQQLIDERLLSWVKQELVLINVSRGAHVNEQALLNALDEGRIKAAVLDVFATEPLPPSHPFWSHARVTITPHSSARSDVQQTANLIASAYKRLTSGDYQSRQR